jgi:hypothetical protein
VAALWIPHGSACSTSKDDGKRMVVVGSKVVLSLDCFLGGSSMVGVSSTVCTVGGHGSAITR